MDTHYLRRAALSCAALMMLAACGGKADAGQDAASTAGKASANASTPVIQHQQLSDSALAGIDPSNVSVDLPWTGNSVRRAPSPSAAWATLQSVHVSGHTGFDRAIFTFAGGTPFPGYHVQLQKAGTTLSCDGKEQPSKLQGDVLLTVSLTPSRAKTRSGKPIVRLRTLKVRGQKRMVQQGLTCDAADRVVWAAGLSQGTELRILELRKPQRLVVDVR